MAETLSAPADTGEVQRPATAPAKSDEKKIQRQMVSFTFLKVMPEWRRLAAGERAEHKRLFADILKKWNQPGRLLGLTYSTEDLNQMTAELLASPLGGYLETPYSYLAMTKRSQYLIGHEHEGQHDSRGSIRPGGQKYIFVYPFWKTRAWYLLPLEERQRLMTEHIRIGHLYPRVKLNTTYSFGIDDQEFVVAFETNFPEDFLDLVQQLRETEISAYTLKDTPIFTCIRMTPEEMLDRLG